MKPLLGERYESPNQLKRALAFYALANGYKLYFKVVTPNRLLAKCCKDNLDRKCPFRLWASWMQFEKSFQIKTLVDDHACSKTYEYETLITSNWIARNYAKKLMVNPNIKVKEIQALILKKYKCKVSISQARRGKIKALKQYVTCLQDHYGMLWSYAQEVITSNPGSSCMMSIEAMPDGKPYFKSFYVCFKGLKEGWLAGCRRVIGLDGCFLKTICKDELLSAVGRDGNNQIYPIAWAVVSIENKENWSWFMKCLIEDLQITDGEGLTIISYQHKGLVEAAKDIMPLSEHRQCARHIYANFRKHHNGVVYRNLFWKAAKSTYPAKFEAIMKELKEVSKDAHKHLMDRQPQSWSKAFYTTDKACDAVENGISECFNSLIVETRRKPIINMLKDIRIGVMERMQKMREKHEKWSDELCPNIRKRLEIIKDLHRHWKVIPSGESRFEVRNGFEGFKVDERLMTCSCRAWQLTGIPCQHGCAAIYSLHKTPDDYVSNWYKKGKFVAAYSHYIEGMNGMEQWPVTEQPKPLPPIVKKLPGRRKHKRNRDASEGDGNRTRISRVGRTMHCKYCGEPGHNRKGCLKRKSDEANNEPTRRVPTQVAQVNQPCVNSNQHVRGTKSVVRRGSMSARGGMGRDVVSATSRKSATPTTSSMERGGAETTSSSLGRGFEIENFEQWLRGGESHQLHD